MHLTGGTPASERLYYVATKWARRLSFVPYVRAFILTGSVQKKTASYSSDIDMIVVCKDCRAWLVHAQLFIFLSVLGMRRTTKTRAGKICVNATISENNFSSATVSDGKLLWYGRSRFIILEKICDALHVSDILERVARKTVGAHVEKKFSRHRKAKTTVLNNTETHVQYYPPRMQHLDSVAARKAHS